MEIVNKSWENILVKIFILACSFVFSLYLSNYIGPVWRGLYSFVSVVPSLIVVFLSFGFGSGIIYSLASKKFSLQDVLFEVNKFSTFVVVAFIFIFCIIYNLHWGGDTLNSIGLSNFVLFLISVSFQIYLFYNSRILVGISEFRKQNLLNIVQTLLIPSNVMLFIFLGWDIPTAIMIGNCAACVVLLILNIKVYKDLGKLNLINNPAFKQFSTSYGRKAWGADLASFSNNRMDQVILSYFNKKDLGIYSLAVSFAELLWFISDAIGNIVLTHIAGEENKQKSLQMVLPLTSLMFLVSIATSICIYILIRILFYFKILSDEYYPLIDYYLILVPGIILYIFVKMYSKYFTGIGEVHKTSLLLVIGSGITVILYFVFIPVFFANGACWATSLGYSFTAIMFIYAISQTQKNGYKYLLPWNQEVKQMGEKLIFQFKRIIKIGD